MEGADSGDPDPDAGLTGPDSILVIDREQTVVSSTREQREEEVEEEGGDGGGRLHHNEGSDSGVEVNGGGGVCCAEAEETPVVSCDSSLISCCYSSEDLVSTTIHLSEELRDLSLNAGDGTSEGGSESSSIAGYHNPRASAGGSLRKKTPAGCKQAQAASSRPSSLSSSASRSKTPMSRDRSQPGRHTANRTASSSSSSSSKSLHPSSCATGKAAGTPLTSRARSTSSDPSSRVKPSMKQLTTKLRIISGMGGATDDGRWPSSVSKSHQGSSLAKGRPSVSVAEPKKSSPHVMTSSFGPIESNALEKYATLPRRRRKSAENLTTCGELRTAAMSREPSLNRTASLRRKHVAATSPVPTVKTIPPYPNRNRTTRTKIYHETSIQTTLTGSDVESALAGTPPADLHSRVEVAHRGIQVDRRVEAVERLEGQLKEMQQELTKLQIDKNDLQETKEKLSKEQAANVALSHRLAKLLNKKDAASGDIVAELAKQMHLSNDLAARQQNEITRLNLLCRTLSMDLDKSYAAQKMLLQQQQEGEAEAIEMQDFLQAEKSTLAEALRDTEAELNQQIELVKQRDADLARLQEECSHLVRISEQRRQEVLSMVAKFKSVERRSKDALLQQGAAVSSAAVALSGLGARLDTLVDALVTSYAISEHDLEDVVFHNEAYSDSGSSLDGSPQHNAGSLEVASGSFMAAVLNAIRSATSTSSRHSHTENSSESEPMLSLEPEPVAFANRDVTCNSSPEKRLSIASAADDCEMQTTMTNSESLQNLTEAIIHRQEAEQGEPADEAAAASATASSVLPAHSLVDQVIDVDNLVTKLLKVLRIIQAASARTAKLETIQLSERLNQKEEQKQGAEELVETLRLEVRQLKAQLHCGEVTDNQVISLRERLGEKEVQLAETSHKLCLTKQLLTDNWHQAMTEVKRQYDAIDAALEMMQTVQGVVQQSAPLSKVQRDLEEANFHCASTLPVMATTTPDHNANAPLLTLPTPPSPTINGKA